MAWEDFDKRVSFDMEMILGSFVVCLIIYTLLDQFFQQFCSMSPRVFTCKTVSELARKMHEYDENFEGSMMSLELTHNSKKSLNRMKNDELDAKDTEFEEDSVSNEIVQTMGHIDTDADSAADTMSEPDIDPNQDIELAVEIDSENENKNDKNINENDKNKEEKEKEKEKMKVPKGKAKISKASSDGSMLPSIGDNDAADCGSLENIAAVAKISDASLQVPKSPAAFDLRRLQSLETACNSMATAATTHARSNSHSRSNSNSSNKGIVSLNIFSRFKKSNDSKGSNDKNIKDESKKENININASLKKKDIEIKKKIKKDNEKNKDERENKKEEKESEMPGTESNYTSDTHISDITNITNIMNIYESNVSYRVTVRPSVYAVRFFHSLVLNCILIWTVCEFPDWWYDHIWRQNRKETNDFAPIKLCLVLLGSHCLWELCFGAVYGKLSMFFEVFRYLFIEISVFACFMFNTWFSMYVTVFMVFSVSFGYIIHATFVMKHFMFSVSKSVSKNENQNKSGNINNLKKNETGNDNDCNGWLAKRPNFMKRMFGVSLFIYILTNFICFLGFEVFVIARAVTMNWIKYYEGIWVFVCIAVWVYEDVKLIDVLRDYSKGNYVEAEYLQMKHAYQVVKIRNDRAEPELDQAMEQEIENAQQLQEVQQQGQQQAYHNESDKSKGKIQASM